MNDSVGVDVLSAININIYGNFGVEVLYSAVAFAPLVECDA